MEKKRDSLFLKNRRDDVKPERKNKKDVIGIQKSLRQEEFNKNRQGLELIKEKKPFDKKEYRLKKYSKKYKLDQWEEQRKKKLLRKYHKDIKNDSTIGTYKAKSFDEDAIDGDQQVGKYVRHPDLIDTVEKEKFNTSLKTKRDPFLKAKEQYNKVKEEKLEKQKEIERIKEERKQKLDEYKKKKHDRFKKLSKKTKKGQPVMTGRLELLLEKIQNSK